MASNKHASIRYRVLDKCFANPVKKYFLSDLIAACNLALKEIDPDSSGISKRTIQSDIKHMESAEGFHAQITRCMDAKKAYYRYAEKDFSIDKQPLNQAELEQIKAAMQVLSHFKGMPQFEWLNELKPKMENALLLEQESSAIISFDNNQYLTGIEHLSELFYAILYKKPLCIGYQSYRSEEVQEFILHPYYLKQYNNRWFLLGWNAHLERMTNLALDRIKWIKEEAIAYVEGDINFDDYFDDIIGVTLPEDKEKEKIILKFLPSAAPYIVSKPLHHSQKKISYTDSELTISIEVIPNYELESLILGFGEKVEVIAPEDFKLTLIERVEKTLRSYHC